ncbi:MAG: protease modulator HflC, partial [Lachnospiraceae bacterium]|nr:protease modulator HflC [Lachnospiraceae bacterium]
MSKNKAIIFFVGLAALIVLSASLYIVNPMEYKVVRAFGRIERIDDVPGLKFKIPFIQSTQTVTKALNTYDLPASDVITKDKKSMIADNYVFWKVVDPTKYLRTLNGIEDRAKERIDAAVYNSTKNVISSMTQDEVIEARDERLTDLITDDANTAMSEYGIIITQSQIKALDLPDDNKEAVYQRMISERNNIAASYRAEGEAQAQKIRNETDRTVAVTKAQARKEADILIAEGEAEYMRILSGAYDTSEKADFYNFIRSLDALKESLKGQGQTIILGKDSEL